MNYYILPKNNFDIKINAQYVKKGLLEPYISQSVIRCFKNNIEQLNKTSEFTYEIDTIYKIANTFEFLFSLVPNTKLTISKVKTESNIFFELLEIFYLCNINELFTNMYEMSIMNITPNNTSSSYLLNIIREDKNDLCVSENFDINKLELFLLENSYKKQDFLFFEFNKNDYQDNSLYFNNMILVLRIILKQQKLLGVSIIKIENMFYKPIIEIIYILSGLFEKVFIIKPSVCNNLSNEKYLVCKGFMPLNYLSCKEIYLKLSEIVENKEYELISILKNEIPYFFTNKIEEANIIIGQQQLEIINLIINIIKNRNKEDKLEILKRQNIQKCIQWCEKYKIPHNKFLDKTNIFLNNTHTKEEEEEEI